jgi:putative mycofactocin binding protein MftB
MNVSSAYQQADGVSIRPERFGALVYRHDTRRLCFIRSHLAAEFVGSLDGTRPLAQAVEDFVARRALPEDAGDMLLNAVGELERMGIVQAVPTA